MKRLIFLIFLIFLFLKCAYDYKNVDVKLKLKNGKKWNLKNCYIWVDECIFAGSGYKEDNYEIEFCESHENMMLEINKKEIDTITIKWN